jgi:hypothetical protein
MIKIKVELPDIASKLSSEKIDALVKSLAQKLWRSAQTATPVDSTMAKRSWTQPERIQFQTQDATFPVSRRSVGYAFGNIQPYSRVLEKGSQPGKRPWPSAGPRTVEQAGRIYSSQAPGGIFENAEIEKVVERELPKIMEKLLSD